MLCRSAYHRHCWASQEGTLDIVDVGAAERIEAVPAHTGPVWSLAALPDSSGVQPALRCVPPAPAPCSGPTTEDFADCELSICCINGPVHLLLSPEHPHHAPYSTWLPSLPHTFRC